jgi:hypothetical protein
VITINDAIPGPKNPLTRRHYGPCGRNSTLNPLPVVILSQAKQPTVIFRISALTIDRVNKVAQARRMAANAQTNPRPSRQVSYRDIARTGFSHKRRLLPPRFKAFSWTP